MKYTTKSGKELPPEVVEVIEQMKKEHGKRDCIAFGINWESIPDDIDRALTSIWYDDNFTKFYKLYPKKDLDSYGNEIVKGEMVHAADHENMLGLRKYEFYGIATKADNKYLAYTRDMVNCCTFKFCRKINSNASKKSELESQMNDLLTKANELKQKIKELFKIIVKREIKEEVEIDIEFPAFFKKGDNIIKAFSQYNNVWIRKKTDIDHNYLGIDYIIEQNYEPSTPEEFNAALESAINYINEINK